MFEHVLCACLAALATPEVSIEESQRQAIQALDPELAGLLQCKDVSLQAQAMLASKKVKSIGRLAAVADDRSGVREFCNTVLGLKSDVADGAVEVASVVDAWSSAQVRIEARHKAEAEAVVGACRKSLHSTELSQLRDRVEQSFFKLPDTLMPANATLEQHFDMLGNGEFTALSLREYASKDDASQEPFAATIDRSTGAIKVRKSHVQMPLPTSAEEIAFAFACGGSLFCDVLLALSAHAGAPGNRAPTTSAIMRTSCWESL